MNKDFLKFENIGGTLKQFQTEIRKNSTYKGRQFPAVSLFKLTDGAKNHIISQIDGQKLLVVADKLQARNMVDHLNGIEEGSAVLIAERDDTLLNVKTISNENLSERIHALSKLLSHEAKIGVVSAEGLLQKYAEPKLFEKMQISISKGDAFGLENLLNKLAQSGYSRQERVGEFGDFSVRGDIVDIFPMGEKSPVRISFFDDEVEEIKLFDLETMSSKSELEKIFISPASDILVDENALADIVENDEQMPDHAKFIFRELQTRTNVGACPSGLVWLRPFLKTAQSSILEFFEKGSVVIFDEPKLVYEKLGLLMQEHESRVKALLEEGEISAKHKDAIFDVETVFKKLNDFKLLSLATFNTTNQIFKPTEIFNLNARPVTKYYLDTKSLIVDVRNYVINNFKVILCVRSEDTKKAIFDTLREENCPISTNGEPQFGKAILTSNGVEEGFLYPEEKIVVVGASELSGRKHGTKKVSMKSNVIDIKEGDFVVHSVHGVGICVGTTRMKISDYEKECIVLKYKNDDLLYVSTDQMDNVHKFIGEDNPPLNKLGGKEFFREKEKVKKSVRKLAIDLLHLYAEREKNVGYKYPVDTEWQVEFEDAFPYDETPDQMEAINTIKKEMESGKIVDRLVCGDVGFGKTEVAIRIIFKTILENKQAVLLAPTTILCKQHYELLNERLKPFGIECGMLSRLQTQQENKLTLKRLEEGSLHVVVGTHRLLSKDVGFHDLGLLVLDEEQRFGVEHKEKLKNRFPKINVVTLSATPIPRTLNMALTGVRDISLLETAPKGRLPVQTYVVEFSDALCKDAISRELARGGQVLILFNSVEHIGIFAHDLQMKIPEAKILFAHGQMAPLELENKITAFYEKKYDVLISTTIIENGIDLPDANTLIVVDSEHFGLSQLYQLRGRVGRRGALAHAYFTVPRANQISEIAVKRLNALMDNTDIGSGYRISIADLSIRGAGTMLGAEQHGHIEHVGYEMYVDLLNKTIQEIKTGKPMEDENIEFKVSASAYIRNDYVSSRDKLRIYKRISSVTSLREREELIEELTDIYGDVDAPLRNLIGIALMKNFAIGNNIKSIIINKKNVAIQFNNESLFRNQRILNVVADDSKNIVLSSTIPPALLFNHENKTPEEKIEMLVQFFAKIQ